MKKHNTKTQTNRRKILAIFYHRYHMNKTNLRLFSWFGIIKYQWIVKGLIYLQRVKDRKRVKL